MRSCWNEVADQTSAATSYFSARICLRAERLLHGRARGEQLDGPAAGRGGAELVEPAQDALLHAIGLCRLDPVLVVDRDVVEDVLPALAVHPVDALAHDDRELVCEGRVVGEDVRDRRCEQVRLPVVVLEPLAGERRASGGGAHQEAAPARVAEGPDLVAGALEPEHRVERVERHHRLGPGRVRGAGGLERGHRAGLGDALLEQLPIRLLDVRQEQLLVDRRVALAERVVDADLLEEGIHAEGPRLVGNDRHDALADLRVAHEVPRQPAEGHRRARRSIRAGEELGERVARGRRKRLGHVPALRDDPAEGRAALEHVLDLGRVLAGVVVRRLLEMLVGDRQLEPVAEDLQLVLVQLLRLVGDVPAGDPRTERPTLQGLGEDDRRPSGVGDRGRVGGVDLAVVVAASAELGEVVIGQVLDELAQPWIRPEEVSRGSWRRRSRRGAGSRHRASRSSC